MTIDLHSPRCYEQSDLPPGMWCDRCTRIWAGVYGSTTKAVNENRKLPNLGARERPKRD